ncbi:E3 ubiquitin ligase [Natronolimnobius sp. AArcel1]|uniref:GIDE domain-containing protein n=1 Tax=Natronolimnobius sp. AArcel1 TaxID=1679093 RepID=UPI0013EE0D41|nr:GIDE domain-containing protein [Natronolimnobius sp. AArcel1]NGM68249.1 E3 ubiquitin ligase [Natronolimnobius sp. AArcel1]
MAGSLFVLLGLCAMIYGGFRLRPAYHVYRGDTDDVLSVERAEGPVELEGTATPITSPSEGPLTGKPCLVYEYEVEELQSSGKNSSWNTVDEGAGGVPFRLEDDTASIRVNPSAGEFALSTVDRIDVDGGEAEPDRVREFLEHHSDLESENTSVDLHVVEIATGNDRRYYERRLEPGGDVYVLGQSRYDVDARETMRDVSAVIEDGPETPVFVIGDSCQDGAARLLAKPAALWLAGGLLAVVLGVALLL